MLSKKTKYGIKALTFWRQENQIPVAIADIAKAKTFRLSFRKYFIAFASFGFLVLRR
jgi:DNA-binding IscR family transcriptional regulator